MTRLSEQKQKMGKPIEANPLPETKVEGDSSDTEVGDENDTPPGIPQSRVANRGS
jgi:hypothetical protein